MAPHNQHRQPAARFLALMSILGGVCIGATKRVSTGKDFVEALMDSSVDVALIVVPALYPSDEDFRGHDLPIRLTRERRRAARCLPGP